ncbi:MAG: ATP-binding cassette domain-containing protein [Methanomicrobiales archaeon]|jgi:cobalt/nickel transport system ATP-binding protein|nr:ATP-binding cassette domain-containing protein [Methanomicrobiales archaeon]
MHLIETRYLCYSYKTTPALWHVNFTAERKQKIAVIGANGAGKSTLFKHFCGILHPSSGEIRIRGELVTKKNLKEVRKTVGVVFQNPDDQIFSVTVEQDIAFGPTNLGLDTETVKHRVSHAMDLLSVSHLASRPPHQLSGGEKKRVAIAGVLAMEPSVLVLDEATAGLDPKGVRDLMAFLQRLPEEFGMTVIFATHHTDLVIELADIVYVLDNGTVAAVGSVTEIFSQFELLDRLGIDLPSIPLLHKRLQERGVPIPMAYSVDESLALLTQWNHQGGGQQEL